MVVHRSMSRWLRRVLVAVVALGAIAYFGWHGFHGNYGLFAREHLRARVAELSRDLAEVQAERRAMDHRVQLMKAQSIDPDILEERSRETLSIAHPNDVVIFQRPPEPPRERRRN